MTRLLFLFLLCFGHFNSYANDNCQEAIVLTPGITCSYTSGTFSGTTIEGVGPSCAGQALQDVWYKFTATDATMSIELSYSPGLNLAFQLYQGGCGESPVACINYNGMNDGESFTDTNFTIGEVYYIRVLNANPQVSAANFFICVRNTPAPANDLCADATQLTPNTTCSYVAGTFTGSLKDGPSSACAPTILQDVWYKFTATDVTMAIYVSADSGNPAFEITEGGCNGTVMACVNYIVGSSESYYNNNFVIGQEYYIRMIEAAGQLHPGSFSICVTGYSLPANDLCANATQLTANAGCSYTAGTFTGSLKDGITSSCATAALQDVWYKFTATHPTIGIYVSADSGNPAFEIIQGGCGGAVLACVNYIVGSSESYYNNNFVVGQEYYIRMIEAVGQLHLGTFSICVTGYPLPSNDLCTNATQLTPNTTCSYVAGTFTGALMDGAAPSCATAALQDVWYKFTATDATMGVYFYADSGNPAFEIIEGGCGGTVIACVNNVIGTSESYSGSNFVAGQEYYLRAIESVGQLHLGTFSICLTGPAPVCIPSVSVGASATEICEGQSVTFTATPVNQGTSASYQWKINGNATGTNSPNYTTTSLINGDSVTVTMTGNAPCASIATVTSDPVVMEVNTINAQVSLQGNTITASAANASFEWINCSDSQPVPGAVSASFTPTADGSYAVIVTQNGCSKTSGCTLVTGLATGMVTKKDWKVYPNPVTHYLFIETIEATEIRISDTTGKNILIQTVASARDGIDVSALSAGIYILSSNSGKHMKFVKE